MIDPVVYRMRIRYFNLRNRTGKIHKKRGNMKYNYGPSLCNFLLLYIGLLSVSAVLNMGVNKLPGPGKYSAPKLGSDWNNVTIRKDIWLSGSYCTSNWNSHIRALNGNFKNTLTLAHWNGGSSFLGKCNRGKEK